MFFLFGLIIGLITGIIVSYFFPDRLNPFVESLMNIFKKNKKSKPEDAEFTVEEDPENKK